MEEDLLNRLRAANAITELLGSPKAIKWIERSRDLPSLTMTNIAPGRSYTFEGASRVEGSTVRFDCWGRSFGETKLIERALVAELERPASMGDTQFQAGFLEASRSMEPEDLGSGIKVFRQSLDLTIWHSPA
ncbi:MAG: hypothetical protein WA906_13955 [Pacificimonas sp.]